MIAVRVAKKGEAASTVPSSQERKLLRAFKGGDPRAFAEVFRSYRAPVYGYLCRCGMEAAARDDLFQDIFLRVHRGASSYELHRAFKPWLFTIAVNTVRSHFRKQRVREIVYEDHAVPSFAPECEQLAQARQTAEWLEGAIGTLPLAQREVVGLVCAEHMPQREAAEVLGIPLGTVKTLLRRARIELARQLARRNRETT